MFDMNIYILIIVILVALVNYNSSAKVRIWSRENYPTALPIKEYRAKAARIGKPIPPEGIMCLVYDCEDTGCSRRRMKRRPAGDFNWTGCWAVICRRGSCEFKEKFWRAHQRNFHAIIVHERWRWGLEIWHPDDSWLKMGSEEDETRSPSDNVSQIVGVWMKRHEAYFISQNYYYYSGYMVEILERAWTWHWDPYDRSMLMAMALLAFLLSMMAGAYIHAATDACDCACDCEPKCDYPYPEEQDQTTTYSDYNSTDMCDCSTPESYCCTATYTHSPTSSDVSGTTSGSGDSRYR